MEEYKVFVKGEVCWGLVDYVRPLMGPLHLIWFDGLGRTVATATREFGDSGERFTYECARGDAAPETFVVDSPECAPWSDLAIYGQERAACQPGCCPPVPAKNIDLGISFLPPL